MLKAMVKKKPKLKHYPFHISFRAPEYWRDKINEILKDRTGISKTDLYREIFERGMGKK